MLGQLTLIPTPIDDETPLEAKALELLLSACENESSIFVVEEHKVARRRWIRWGLPREKVNDFILLNEHKAKEVSQELVQKLKSGNNVFLMSDCGLPAFCDPGRELVDLCHHQKIKVSASAFPNSIALAVALSGFAHNQFYFFGFPPAKNPDRSKALKDAINFPKTTILMDTPYRMKKILEELSELMKQTKKSRQIFLATNLNQGEKEELYRGGVDKVLNQVEKDGKNKEEFILILGS